MDIEIKKTTGNVAKITTSDIKEVNKIRNFLKSEHLNNLPIVYFEDGKKIYSFVIPGSKRKLLDILYLGFCSKT